MMRPPHQLNEEYKESILDDFYLAKRFATHIDHASMYAEELKEFLETPFENRSATFERDYTKTLYAMSMTIQILGEEIQKFSDWFRYHYFRNIHWLELKRMRNTISHAYQKVDINDLLTLIDDFFPAIKGGLYLFAKDVAHTWPNQ